METKIFTSSNDYSQANTVYLAVSTLFPRQDQPRRNFSVDKIEELAISIKNFGIIQPIIVKTKKEGGYWIISGERRWRAASLIGLEKVPCLISIGLDNLTDEVALIENTQREDLNPIEEALALQKLLEKSGQSIEKLSETIGKKRSSISNHLRLLSLPNNIQNDLQNGFLTLGHAKALCSISDTKILDRIRKLIISKGLSVRQTENLVQKAKQVKHDINDDDLMPTEIRNLCDQIKGHLGTKVKILGTPQNGKIEVCYFSIEDLERISDLILGLNSIQKNSEKESLHV